MMYEIVVEVDNLTAIKDRLSGMLSDAAKDLTEAVLYQASLSGIKIRSGAFRNSFKTVFIDATTIQVSSDLVYADVLEQGTYQARDMKKGLLGGRSSRVIPVGHDAMGRIQLRTVTTKGQEDKWWYPKTEGRWYFKEAVEIMRPTIVKRFERF